MNISLARLIAGCTLILFLTVPIAFANENKLDSSTFKQTLVRDIEKYTQDIASNKNLNTSLEARAWCYYQIGEYDKAVSDYSEAIHSNIKPSNGFLARLYFGRSFAYSALDRYQESISDYRQAIENSQSKPLQSFLQSLRSSSTNIILILLVVGVVLYIFASKLFGPSGLIKILAKNSYENHKK